MDVLLYMISTLRLRYNLLAFVAVVIQIALCLEEPTQEIFLRPRNFNPHPYEISEQRRERTGPVLFPPSPDDNQVDRSNFVTPRTFLLREPHPVDGHPYAKVARKHKYGRFGGEDRRNTDKARKALAEHGAQVLSYPPEKLAKYKTSSQDQRKDYAFSYKVVDHLRGDDFSHSQSRNSKATNGEYRVKLPDGRVQIVSYTADKNGYKADVKYTENVAVPDQLGTPLRDQSVQLQRIPVRELYPVETEKSLDYHNDVQPPNHNIVVLQAVVPTQIPRSFNGHSGLVVAPSPAYLNAVENRDLQMQHYPKVEIFTTNARDYTVGSYIPRAVPYFRKHSNTGSRTISPVIINNGDLGLSSPTPSSFVLTDHQGLVLDNIKLVSTTSSPLNVQNHVTSTTPVPLILSNLFSTVAPHY